jgi:AraC family ethanolamine operon transcriptional activator
LEPKNHKNTIYLKAICDDFDQFKEAASKWSLDFKQLDSGKFNGEFALLDMGNVLLASIQINRQIEQKSVSPKGYRTFGILADNKHSFIWRGHTFKGNNLLVVPKSGEVEAICYPGFQLFTVSIADDWIESYCEGLGSKESKILNNGIEVLGLNNKSMKIIRQKFQHLFAEVNHKPQIIHNKTYQRNIIDEISGILLTNTIYENSLIQLPSNRIRDVSLQKALEYINTCGSDLPTVVELCLISGASQRTLEYAFKERYRIGPKNYMNKLRLNNVYSTLKKADPDQTKILELAYQNGFTHMGQFCADYKKLFGEIASTTLKKRN